MSGDLAREMLEREWLIGLVENSGRAPEVTDAGYPPAEFVYEVDGRRIEVQIREIT